MRAARGAIRRAIRSARPVAGAVLAIVALAACGAVGRIVARSDPPGDQPRCDARDGHGRTAGDGLARIVVRWRELTGPAAG